jgi:hypothetical protein
MQMRNKLLAAGILLFLLISCNKQPLVDDISGENEVRGTIYLNDSLQNLPQEIAQKNLTVLLKHVSDSNTLNYIYAATTDAGGNFLFTNLSAISYILYAEKDVNGLLYSGKSIIQGGINTSVKIVLYPDVTKYNILSVTAKDLISNSPLYNAKICIFNNRTLAKNNLCEGAVFSGSTNQYGKIFTSKLDTGWHYINAQLVTAGITLNAKDSIHITSKTGVIVKTINLQ